MKPRTLHGSRTMVMIAVTLMAMVGIGSFVAVAAQPSTPSTEAFATH